MTNQFGCVEIFGIHDRTNYDFKRHVEFSNQNLAASGRKVRYKLEGGSAGFANKMAQSQESGMLYPCLSIYYQLVNVNNLKCNIWLI